MFQKKKNIYMGIMCSNKAIVDTESRDRLVVLVICLYFNFFLTHLSQCFCLLVLKTNPCSKQMAGIKCWMMDREIMAKATTSVPPGRLSHEGTIEEFSSSIFVYGVRSAIV